MGRQMGDKPQDSGLSDEQIQTLLKLERIFLPRSRKHRDETYKSAMMPDPKKASARFVHYTSADAALKIINSKRIWMRNTTCMVDYREVQHGYDILRAFFADASNRAALVSAVDACAPGAINEAIKMFDDLSASIQLRTFVTSVSEHDDCEDLHGRLSMWRAFGGNTARVALVLRVPWHSPGARSLKLTFSPIAYFPQPEVHSIFHEVVENVKADCEFLKTVDRNLIVGSIFEMLLANVTCLKHEGFREEREWRVIYSPDFRNSPLIEWSTEVIGGVPQCVYKIPLDATRDSSLADLDLSKIFDCLIIGPSPYTWAMYEAFVLALRNAGVPEPEKRVRFSEIPIRA
jgi:hypothetical protein